MSAPDKDQLLFVSHDASRSGAPMVLLHLLRWFGRRYATPFSVVLGDSGPMAASFEAVAPTLRLDAWRAGGRFGRAVERRAPRLMRWRHRRALAARPASLVYLNSIANAAAMRALGPGHPPIICHVHELEYAVRASTPPEWVRWIVDHAALLIAAGEPVRDNLIRNHGARPERVEVVGEFVAPPAPGPAGAAQDVRRGLGIPPDAPVVCAAGSLSWRKGSDLFVQSAMLVRDRAPACGAHFVWVGGDPASPQWLEFEHDVRKAGLARRVHLVAATPRLGDYLAQADVFALPSREDPFPLVCLEAAAAGVPTVCFESAGGIPDFVRDDGGRRVPYLNVDAFAAGIAELVERPALRASLGATARARGRAGHDVSVAGPRIAGLIERVLGRPLERRASDSSPA